MAKKEAGLKVGGKVVPISNLEKVFYPATGFTKAQVIDYYIRISSALLPHLKNRPVTMKRYPDGVEGEHFYEKNAPSHTPGWIKTAVIGHRHREGVIRYILLNDLPSLVWSANMANLELHTFLGRVPRVGCPTMIVFDLDPGPPAGILECAQVALWLKEIFASIHLECFAKSSGSKGIQVYIPLNTSTNYETTRMFAETTALLLAHQHPDLVVATMAKDIRTGKVFIDWSQNAEHKTTVNVYSLRAQWETPSISTPLVWSEMEVALKKGDANHLYFEPEAVLRRVEKFGDLFEPLLKMKQKLPKEYQVPTRKRGGLKKKKTRVAAKGDHSMDAYLAKRDFDQTKEPPPSRKKKRTKKKTGDLMFVIQKHRARRLHYDFRLEMEGALRSWAVPNGIPFQIGDKKLSVHVEDHPMDYAEFEGVIPEGNYGAGTVMVWDIGTYQVLHGEDPVEAYRKGKISLALHGKKLNGEWTLVKTRSRNETQESWLMLKKGENVRPVSAKQDDRSVLSGRTMKQIAKDRDAEWISGS